MDFEIEKWLVVKEPDFKRLLADELHGYTWLADSTIETIADHIIAKLDTHEGTD